MVSNEKKTITVLLQGQTAVIIEDQTEKQYRTLVDKVFSDNFYLDDRGDTIETYPVYMIKSIIWK